MIIKTKLDIFDRCFYLEDNIAIEDEVTGVKIKQIKDRSMDIAYVVGKNSDKAEQLVFRTKEELLASL